LLQLLLLKGEEGHLPNDGPLALGLRLPFGGETIRTFSELFVAWDEEAPAGAESVFECILAGGGLTFRGFGACGALPLRRLACICFSDAMVEFS
jgi:hypothetical protein